MANPITAFGIALALLTSVPAQAEAPWNQGVPTDAQTRARAAYEDGKALLEGGFFVQAIEAFRRALTAWDHPSTRFLLAQTLQHLDAAPEAVVEYWAAMRYGGKPLELDQIGTLKYYANKLMRDELAMLVIRQASGPIFIDGHMVSANAHWIGIVRAGTHKVGSDTVTMPANHRIELAHGVTSRPLDEAALDELQLALVGFVVRYPSKDEYKGQDPKTPHPPDMPVSPEVPVSLDTTLPPTIVALCANATAQLALICRHYEANHAALVKSLREAERRAMEAEHRAKRLHHLLSDPVPTLR